MWFCVVENIGIRDGWDALEFFFLVLTAAPAAGARTSSTAGAEAEEEPVKNEMTRMNRPPKAQ